MLDPLTEKFIEKEIDKRLEPFRSAYQVQKQAAEAALDQCQKLTAEIKSLRRRLDAMPGSQQKP